MSSEPILSAACPVPQRETDCVVLGHGSGGRLSADLIEGLIVPALRNDTLEALDDAADLPFPAGARLAFTTDSFVVSPLFFPGGDIGELAVHGTINDLAVAGADPVALSLAFILEEGLPMEDLTRIVASVKRAAARVGVPIVTGDTKVVGRGHADGIFINTSGVGRIASGRRLGSAQVRPGDAILVSGTIGDHGVAIMAQREGLDLAGDLRSDTAPLHDLCRGLLTSCPTVHAMRDPTRGGVAATLVEIATRRGLGVEVEETALPIHEVVRGTCELLSLDPMLVANEGKLVAFVPEDDAEDALAVMRAHPLGERATRIGTVTEEHCGSVIVRTPFGGRRVLDLPLSEPLPRIC